MSLCLHAAVMAAAPATGAFAQAPSHQHYATTAEAQRPAPDGSLAPRLQNLGSHTFPVTTSNARAQLFMYQGLNLESDLSPVYGPLDDRLIATGGTVFLQARAP